MNMEFGAKKDHKHTNCMWNNYKDGGGMNFEATYNKFNVVRYNSKSSSSNNNDNNLYVTYF
jgi:hypothetical protein